jgi:hypothetical protein
VRPDPLSPPLPGNKILQEVLIGQQNALCNQQHFMREEKNDNAEDITASSRNTVGQVYRGQREEIEQGRAATA